MLVACFGIHKSASTFAYRMATESANELFEGEVLTGGDVSKVNKAYVDEKRDIITASDRVLIQKTHSGTNIDLTKLIKNGDIRVIASIRDLRDIALSMIDAGNESREGGLKNMMASVYTVDDAIEEIKNDVRALNRWSEFPNVLFIPYNEIRVSPETVIQKIAKTAFDRDLTIEECQKIDSNIPRSTIRLNKGIQDRYKTEMSEADSQKILSLFPEFYEKFAPLFQE